MQRSEAIRNSTELLNLSYEYNRGSVGSLSGKTGHLTKIIDNLNTNKNGEYEFDALGRLTKAKGGTTGTLWNQTYSYDRYGNRTNVTASGTAADSSAIPLDGTPNLTYQDTSNRITTSGYDYDVAGNQTKGYAADGTTSLTYEYDAANRIAVIKKTSDGSYVQAFQYGSTNARLIDWDGPTGQNSFYCSVGGMVMAEYIEYTQNNPTWTKSYTYLGDTQLATVTPNGSGGETVEFNHPDRLGTRLKTDQSAGTSVEQAHLPFGTALNAESTLTNNNKRFTSYDRSSSTGLDYAINRTYDNKLGRFTQVDPIDLGSVEPMNPQTLNLYNYCGNDPINSIDPDGLFFGKLFKWLGKMIKKALKWLAVAISVALAVVVVIFAPIFFATSLKLIFGIVAAVANAASSVLNAFGLTRAGAMFGIIAGFASFGTSFLNARSALNWKTFFSAISSAATATSRTLSFLGHTKLGRVFGLAGTVTGFVADGIQADPIRDPNDPDKILDYRHFWDSSKWKIYKFARSSTEQVARLAGANRVAGYLNAAGIADDVGDAIAAYRDFRDDLRRIRRGQAGQKLGPPSTASRLDFWSNTRTALTGSALANAQGIIFMRNVLREFGSQAGRYNSIIGRVERSIALAR